MKQFPAQRHHSQRGEFAAELYEWMSKDKDIWLIVGDLGYKVFDYHFRDFPDRCINTGAAEQAMMGIGVGLALEGKKPFVYSITPFLLWRPAETIRNYINHEKIPVRLVGSGRDQDYAHDGFSHYAGDDADLLYNWRNIQPYWPSDLAEVRQVGTAMALGTVPAYINLTR
jgi:transketolase